MKNLTPIWYGPSVRYMPYKTFWFFYKIFYFSVLKSYQYGRHFSEIWWRLSTTVGGLFEHWFRFFISGSLSGLLKSSWDSYVIPLSLSCFFVYCVEGWSFVRVLVMSYQVWSGGIDGVFMFLLQFFSTMGNRSCVSVSISFTSVATSTFDSHQNPGFTSIWMDWTVGSPLHPFFDEWNLWPLIKG